MSDVQAASTTPGYRLNSLDLVRGIVMVLMAVDHVRVYSGVPAGGPTLGVFFTRWITHFCAPAFAFFAGTGAFLYGRKLGDMGALSRYLAARGFMLIVLEFTVLHIAWTFTFDFSHLLAGVIWMLGVCMILLAGLVRFSARAVGIFGLLVIFGQQVIALLAGATPQSPGGSFGWFGQFLYFGGEVKFSNNALSVSVLYSIIPWVGVMAAGYAFGAIMVREREVRDRLCLGIGVTATALFLVFGCLNIMLHPAAENAP